MGLSFIDWTVLIATLVFVVGYGMWKSQGSTDAKSFISGGKEASWFTVGLSVMATQASAITFMSTPGQAFHDGMGFVQFYFGLPLAMVFISIFFLPIYNRLNIVTAYEYLEHRFDNRTRAFTSLLFLLQRGLGAGITIYAPAIILSTILGWDLKFLTVILGALVIIYTVSGGTKAVNVTHKQQMFIIMGGMFFAFYTIIHLLPESIGFTEAFKIAKGAGKMNILDFSLNPESRYTVWSGLTGGFFLALSYFGTDQSQVQRYLSAKNEGQSRIGLMMNGLLKVPMQFFILLCGAMLFVFFQFNKSPVFFNNAILEKARSSEKGIEIERIEQEIGDVFDARQALLKDSGNSDMQVLKELNAKEKSLRDEAKTVIGEAVPGAETNDKDYVFIHFILNFLPIGFVGLLLAVVFSASMSSTASELNALAATTAVDIYQRNFAAKNGKEVTIATTRWFTLLWGIIAILFASFGTLFDNLIQFVNIVGSIFYGTILGVFLTGFFIKTVSHKAVFPAAIITQCLILLIFKADLVSYLWLNVIGALGVILIGILIQQFISTPPKKISS